MKDELKTLGIILGLLSFIAVVIFAGVSRGNGLRTIEHDGCEYVILKHSQKDVAIIHKENCKFCEAK